MERKEILNQLVTALQLSENEAAQKIIKDTIYYLLTEK